MEDTIRVDEAILYKYFTGEISNDEEQVVLEWLEKSEENRSCFFDMKAIWNAREVFAESTDLAGFADFLNRTNKRIDQIESHAATPRHKIVRWPLAAAASVALILTAGLAWLMLSTPNAFKVYENPTDEISTVQLSDGTQVWLSAQTTLTLPKAFDKSQRNVKLSGAAFFDVTPDLAAPFVVHTQNLQIRVLGTTFSVKSYQGSDRSEVILERGSVRLATIDGVNLVKLHPDQCAIYDAADDNLEVSTVNASHLVLSQYDLVTMENVTLHEIISRIESAYGVRISVAGRYNDKHYTFNFQRSNSLDQVLRIVEYMTGEKCELVGRPQ